jgi:3-oxoacyl-[acyl-carrier-protein] synthase III
MGGQWTGLGHAVPGRVVTNAELVVRAPRRGGRSSATRPTAGSSTPSRTGSGCPPNDSWSTWTGVGNTAAAGHRVALAAFGGGTTWGAATLTWPEMP